VIRSASHVIERRFFVHRRAAALLIGDLADTFNPPANQDEADVATVLYTLSGAIASGTLREFAAKSADFARAKMAVIDRVN
jgi:hypothetical protein